MLDCPIVMNGKPIGVICCENQVTMTAWGTEEVIFIQSMAENISICYKNLEINYLMEQVRERNIELVEKTNEIETMNEELISMNESLEETVQKRTSELETQNKQLTEYAFINSHILRAPLARILGLSYLFSSEVTADKDKQLLEALIVSSKELDLIIRKISDLLYDGNNMSREDIQAIIDRNLFSEKE
jgi:signal transduction histidine kinase